MLLLVTVLFSFIAAAQPARPVPFEQDGKWGYKSGRSVVISPRFVLAQEFSPDAIAAVVDERGWAYIDRSGKVLIRPLVVDNGPDYFAEGLARFSTEGKVGFFDKHGRVVIQPRHSFAGPFSEGRAAVCDGCHEVLEGEHRIVQGRWGYIDRMDKLLVPFRYDEAEAFKQGRARVRIDSRWKYIDLTGGDVGDVSIGVATMERDGTIVLRLRADGPSGSIGESLLRYPLSHPQYQEILRHIDGLSKGQSKPVPPWPDK